MKSLVRLSPLLIVLTLPLAWMGRGAHAFEVNSTQEFVLSMRTHIVRVRLLGLELLRKHPDKFPGVSEELLASFLRRHDQSKVNPRLSPGDHTIAERLYQNYGHNFNAWSDDQASRSAHALVDELNEIDHRVEFDFFRERQLLNPDGTPNGVAKRLLQVEHVADAVDRGMSPTSTEEFGKNMRRASEFLRDPSERRLAASLEQNYPETVKTATYRRIHERLLLRSNCDLKAVLKGLILSP